MSKELYSPSEEEIVREIDILSEKRERKLTEKQTTFLVSLVKNGFNIPVALKEAGYSPSMQVLVVRKLSQEIVKLAESYLLSKAPEAITTLSTLMLSEKSIPQASVKLQAAKEILDRVGIIKKEEVNVNHSHSGGIFILPEKKAIDISGAVDAV